MQGRKIGQSLKHNSTEWINIERPRKSDLIDIGLNFNFSDDHVKALVADSHRSRLLESEKSMTLMLVHPSFDKSKNDVVSKEIDIIVTDDGIVTIQRSKISAIQDLYNKAESSKKQKDMDSPAKLVFSILHELVSDIYVTLDTMAVDLDDMEKEILSKGRILEDILLMQTNVIDVQKAVDNQSVMVDRFVSTLDKKATLQIQKQYTDIQLHFKEIKNSLLMEQMTAETLHSTHETILNSRINSQVKLLTSLSLLILPATLLSGIFGMNVGFPKLYGMPIGFWMIIGFMILSAISVYLLGKINRR